MQIQAETLLWQGTATGLKKPEAQPVLSGNAVKPPVFRLDLAGDDRINGSVPVWGQPKTPQEEVLQDISSSQNSADPNAPALSLAPLAAQDAPQADEFGFFDLVDMINPLQHIPVVSSIYRAVTGDEIKPVSQIVGGAAFGGVLGAASGIANAIVQEETGKDIGGNVIGMVMGEPAQMSPEEPLPGTTIALADLTRNSRAYND